MWCENYLEESSVQKRNFSSNRIDTIKQRIGAIFNIVHTNKQKSNWFGLAEQLKKQTGAEYFKKRGVQAPK